MSAESRRWWPDRAEPLLLPLLLCTTAVFQLVVLLHAPIEPASLARQTLSSSSDVSLRRQPKGWLSPPWALAAAQWSLSIGQRGIHRLTGLASAVY